MMTKQLKMETTMIFSLHLRRIWKEGKKAETCLEEVGVFDLFQNKFKVTMHQWKKFPNSGNKNYIYNKNNLTTSPIAQEANYQVQ